MNAYAVENSTEEELGRLLVFMVEDKVINAGVQKGLEAGVGKMYQVTKTAIKMSNMTIADSICGSV
ncbi:MAG: hypothetical protein JKY84_00795 [Emcibacteraceae bacterium]|nr:hypothetical protein [Emcibacteraceae bacterium]